MNWLEKLIGDTQARMLRLLRRSRQTITSLASSLGLTDNAVRSHIASLGRDGLVAEVGSQRDTGGKPARIYDLTPAGEELFPKAYSAVLARLIEEVAARDGWDRALELLRAVGVATAPATASVSAESRVAAAAAALRGLGGEIDLVENERGWLLKGYGCPLAAVTDKHPQVCALAHALVSEVTQQPVTEQCDHTDRPRCAFQVHGAASIPA